MKFHLSRPEGGQKGSHVDIWRKSDPGRGLGKCKGPEAANLASKNGILAESESAREEGGGETVREEGVCGRGRVPGHAAFYKGCDFFSSIRMEATGVSVIEERRDLPYILTGSLWSLC